MSLVQGGNTTANQASASGSKPGSTTSQLWDLGLLAPLFLTSVLKMLHMTPRVTFYYKIVLWKHRIPLPLFLITSLQQRR